MTTTMDQHLKTTYIVEFVEYNIDINSSFGMKKRESRNHMRTR